MGKQSRYGLIQVRGAALNKNNNLTFTVVNCITKIDEYYAYSCSLMTVAMITRTWITT